jgi:hypothetical protein
MINKMAIRIIQPAISISQNFGCEVILAVGELGFSLTSLISACGCFVSGYMTRIRCIFGVLVSAFCRIGLLQLNNVLHDAQRR